jgi:hypothetical protein
MAKPKPPRGGLKKGAPETPSPKSFLGALPCLFLILIGIGLLSMFFYAMLTSGVKPAGAK